MACPLLGGVRYSGVVSYCGRGGAVLDAWAAVIGARTASRAGFVGVGSSRQ